MNVSLFLDPQKDDWQRLLTLLPPGWQEQAYRLAILQRIRKIKCLEMLLRVLCLYLLGLSLQEVCLRARSLGWIALSAPSLHKRLLRLRPWLEWIVGQLWREQRDKVPPRRPRRKMRRIVVDGTSATRPGRRGSDMQVHVALELETLREVALKITSDREGETFRHFAARPGELWIGDRGYCNAAGVAHIVQAGGEVLVRYHFKSLPLFREDGRPFPLASRVRQVRRGTPREWPAWVQGPEGNGIRGRLLVKKLSRAQTRKAHRRLRRKAQKNQRHTLSRRAWLYAGYLMLWTTLGEEWTSAEIRACFRERWQVELLFKRLKSILGLVDLKQKTDESVRVWLYGKMLLALLVEKFIAQAEEQAGAIPVPPEKKRSRWKEVQLVYREIAYAILPSLGLLLIFELWREIALLFCAKIKLTSCLLS